MSNRLRPRRTDPATRRLQKKQRLDRLYGPPEPEQGSSRVLTIVLILALFTCLILAAIVALIPIDLLLRWARFQPTLVP